MKWIIKYTILVNILVILCFISFAVAYGYDEGTVKSHIEGKIFTFIFTIFTFPFGFFLPASYMIFYLIADVLFLSGVIILILKYLKKNKA